MSTFILSVKFPVLHSSSICLKSSAGRIIPKVDSMWTLYSPIDVAEAEIRDACVAIKSFNLFASWGKKELI